MLFARVAHISTFLPGRHHQVAFSELAGKVCRPPLPIRKVTTVIAIGMLGVRARLLSETVGATNLAWATQLRLAKWAASIATTA
jgi:hypothetical protein